MRGKAAIAGLVAAFVGITPAYAGKRSGIDFHRIENKDHPRLCGEKPIVHTRSSVFEGSPPPMRGKGVSGFSLTSVSRITPAYAGKRRKAAYFA